MAPVLIENDRIMVSLNCFERQDPKRGDIVVFKPPGKSPATFIKRVLALPGEIFESRDNQIYIDGQIMDDPWISSGLKPTPPDTILFQPTLGPFEIQPGEYYLVGDYRGKSYDSRFYGAVDKSKIKGKVMYIYWSRRPGNIGQTL